MAKSSKSGQKQGKGKVVTTDMRGGGAEPAGGRIGSMKSNPQGGQPPQQGTDQSGKTNR